MNKNCFVKKLALVGVILFSSYAWTASVQRETKKTEKVDISDNTHALPVRSVEGKLLKSQEMDLFNAIWTQVPFVILRINFATKTVKKILQDIQARRLRSPQNDEAEFIAKQVKRLAEPVRKFFNAIEEHADMVKPLIKESIVAEGQSEKDVILMQYFSLNNQSVVNFCQEVVTSIDTLEKIGYEFLQLFSDLNASLNENSRAAYQTLLTKIKAKQEKAKKQVASAG